MMIRKVMVFLLAISLIAAGGLTVLADGVSFPDLPESHWAYPFVSVLVADGTVKGNESGYFEPDKMVTRAEFVKMVGKGPTLRETDFADVPKDHWGYDYIMTSGLNGDANNCFNPSVPMTRGDTLDLLWARAGKPAGVFAPSIITAQASNKDAVAWSYMYGLMVGSDGINLRLSDPVSRAEAATLIVRSRQIGASSEQIQFADKASPKLLEAVYNSARLFDMPYDPAKTVTNGQLARAAVRLMSEEYNLTYRKFSAAAPFEGTYARDLAIIGKCIGQDKVNAAFAEQEANCLDTITALAFAAIQKSHKPVSYGNSNNYYKDVPAMDKSLANTILTFAFENGIFPYSKGQIHPSEKVTLKDIAAILLQLDECVGLSGSITTDTNKDGSNVAYDMKIVKNLDQYPQNPEYFACILKDLPLSVYTTDFEKMPALDGSVGRNPAVMYDFGREYGSMFMDLLKQYKNYLNKEHGIDVRFTYYPSLLCDNTLGYTLRLKCEIINLNGKEYTYQDVFTDPAAAGTKDKLYNGMTFYADAVTDYTMGTGAAGEFAFGAPIYVEK